MAGQPQGRSTSARTGALIFTSLSVALAGAAGWILFRTMSSGGYDREPLQPVVVAKESVGAGHPLRAEDLRVVPWPSSAVPVGAFSQISALLTPTPAVPTSGFAVGEPILKERLASPEAGAGLSALVEKSSRAVAVQVDRSVAAARLVYPGAHVDVLVTLEDRIHGAVITRTVLEDVRVLAVGNFADVDAARRGADPARTPDSTDAVVTLEVSPADAEKLALSVRQGKLDLSLRNATDHSRTPTPGVAATELMAGRPEAPVGDPARVDASGAAAAAAAAASHRRTTPPRTTPTGVPVVHSNPRPDHGGDQPSPAIEVYRVPTQAR